MRAIQRRNISFIYQIKSGAMAKNIMTKIANAYQRSFTELYKRDNK